MQKSEENGKSSEKRSNIIAAVRTPINFFTLTVLVIEGILWKMTNSAQGGDRTILIIGMVSALLLLIIAVAWIALRRPTPPPSPGDLGIVKIYQNNDSPKFSEHFERLFEKAGKIHMLGTGFYILQRPMYQRNLFERMQNPKCEIKIFAANPYSPNVQTRLIEEEIDDDPPPNIRQSGLIRWLQELLRRHGELGKPANFSLSLFPFYPSYALFVFDEQDYFFYPYGYTRLGTTSPVLHFSKSRPEHRFLVDFFDRQYKLISGCSSDADLVFKIQNGSHIEAQRLSAVAVYLIPPRNSELYRFGSDVLEYDVYASERRPMQKWHEAIGAAADFGFHLTVADALYCTHPKDLDLIHREVEFLAKKIRPFTLKFRLQKDFPNQQGIALVCEDESGVLELLHSELVARVYRKAAASNYSGSLGNIARPDRDSNRQRAELMIEHYHAPYVLQRYRPHFSLLSAVPENEKDRLFQEVERIYRQRNLEPEIRIEKIFIMYRPDPDKPWRILQECQLGGA